MVARCSKGCASFTIVKRYRLTLLQTTYTKRTPFTTIHKMSRNLRRQLRGTIQRATDLPTLLSTLAAIHCPQTQVQQLTVSTTLNCATRAPTLPPCLRLLNTHGRTLPLPKRATLPLSRSLTQLTQRGKAYARVITTRDETDSLNTLYQTGPRPVNKVCHRGVVFLAG